MDSITSRRQKWRDLDQAKDGKWQKIEKQLKLKDTKLDNFLDRIKKFRRNRLHLMSLDTEAAYKMHHFGQEEKTKLIEIWDHLNPFNQLKEEQRENYKGRYWIDIGFQGEEPETDFRGSGRLGLYMLHDFIKNYYAHAIECLNTSQQEETQYFFACTSINFTFMMLNRLRVSS